MEKIQYAQIEKIESEVTDETVDMFLYIKFESSLSAIKCKVHKKCDLYHCNGVGYLDEGYDGSSYTDVIKLFTNFFDCPFLQIPKKLTENPEKIIYAYSSSCYDIELKRNSKQKYYIHLDNHRIKIILEIDDTMCEIVDKLIEQKETKLIQEEKNKLLKTQHYVQIIKRHMNEINAEISRHL